MFTKHIQNHFNQLYLVKIYFSLAFAFRPTMIGLYWFCNTLSYNWVLSEPVNCFLLNTLRRRLVLACSLHSNRTEIFRNMNFWMTSSYSNGTELQQLKQLSSFYQSVSQNLGLMAQSLIPICKILCLNLITWKGRWARRYR